MPSGPLYKVFTDQEAGGKAARTECKTLLRVAYQKEFDLVVFWRLDRLSREGTLATLRYLKELEDYMRYKSFTEPYLDSLGPFGHAIVSMLAAIATQDLIKIKLRRTPKQPLTEKKAAGVKLGTTSKNQVQIEQIRRLKSGDMLRYAIGKAMSISTSTVAKYVVEE